MRICGKCLCPAQIKDKCDCTCHKEMKPLIVILQPREIPEVLEAIKLMPADKLYVKFTPQEEAYLRAREFFLNHDDYTHMVLQPDDLIPRLAAFQYLMEDAEHYDVVAGWCNNTTGGDKYDYMYTNISTDHISLKEPHTNTFKDMQFDTITCVERKYPRVIQCKFSGFALQFIARQIIKDIPFRTDFGCCVDTTFGLDLLARNMPQYVDTRCRMTHIRTKPDIIQVGKKDPEVIYECIP